MLVVEKSIKNDPAKLAHPEIRGRLVYKVIGGR